MDNGRRVSMCGRARDILGYEVAYIICSRCRKEITIGERSELLYNSFYGRCNCGHSELDCESPPGGVIAIIKEITL